MRYRLQVALVTRTGAVEVVGEVGKWVIERLRDITAVVDMLLFQKEGDVGRVVGAIGDTLRAPHGRWQDTRVFGMRRRRRGWKKSLGRGAIGNTDGV